MAAPCVSVLMAVFNGGKFLRAAVDSILSQTFTHFEFVIIDDGSTDDTLATLASYVDPRVRLVSAKHAGLTASLNRGLATCRGALIARMDADDVASPDRLAAQTAYFDARPGVDILCADAAILDGHGRVVGAQRMGRVSTDSVISGLLYRSAVKPIIHPTVMMRREVVDVLRGYRDYHCAEDHDFWLRASGRFRFANIDRTLLQYRVHSSGVSRARRALHATSAILSTVNYLVERQSGVDMFRDRPEVFAKLSEIARERMETRILPAFSAFRGARETIGPGRTIAGYANIAKALLRYGPSALPTMSRRKQRRLVESLAHMARGEIDHATGTGA